MGHITIDRIGGGGTAANAPDFENATTITLTANTDNLVLPATTSGTYIFDLQGGDRDLSGIAAPAVGAPETFWFIGDPNNKVKLEDQNTDSLVANRFALPDASNYDMNENVVLILTYNRSTSRWMIIGDGKH